MMAWLVLGTALALQGAPPAKPPDPAPPDRLIRRLGSQRFTHADLIASIAISPDGRLLATGDGKVLKLWEFESGRLVADGLAGGRGLAYSLDGALLATAAGKDVSVLDGATGALVASLGGHLKSVVAAAFSPDGERLATGSDDVTVRVWDLKEQKELYRIEVHVNTVYAVAYSPDGSLLTTGSRDGTIRLWSAEDGKHVRILAGHGDDVRALAFSNDGATLISAGGDEFRTPGEEDCSIRTWDVATGAKKAAWKGHARAVASMAITRDGTALATGGVDGDVRIWELPAGQLRRSIKCSFAARSLAFSADGKKLVAAGAAQAPLILDASTGEEAVSHEGHRGSVQSLQVYDGGTKLAAADMAGEILLWDLKTEKVLRRIAAHDGPVNRATVSPDGRKIASAGRDKVVVVRSLEDGVVTARIPAETEWVTMVSWWPNEEAVMFGGRGKGLDLYDAKTGKVVRTILGVTAVSDAAFAPDGRTLAVSERYREIRVRDVATGASRGNFTAPMGLQCVAFHPSGRWVIGSSSGLVVRDLVDGRSSDLSPGGGPYRPVFSPDGRWIAGLVWGKGIRIVEFISGQTVAELPIKPLRFTDCAFLPGGRTLISGTEDTTLAIWNLDSDISSAAGKELEELWRGMGEAEFRVAVDALVASGDAVVGFLKERLALNGNEKEVARVLGEVAAAEGEALKKSVAELVELGGAAEAPLDSAIAAEKDEVQRARLTKAREELLAPIVKSQSTLRRLRAIEVLERIGSPEALEVLKPLAESAPAARERYEAAASVKRVVTSGPREVK